MQVLNGRFGPYITDGTKNVKIAKDIDPKSITAQQAHEMLAAAPASKGRFGRRKTTEATSATAKAPKTVKAKKKTTKRSTKKKA